MICSTCDQPFPGKCTCPDRDARLESMRQSKYIALRWCAMCDKHADLCECPQGTMEILVSGEKP